MLNRLEVVLQQVKFPITVNGDMDTDQQLKLDRLYMGFLSLEQVG